MAFSFRRGYSKAMYWRDMFNDLKRQYNLLKQYHAKRKIAMSELRVEHRELKAEFERFKRQSAKELAKATKDHKDYIEKNRKLMQLLQLYKKNSKKKTVEHNLLRKQLHTYNTNKRFFTKELIWHYAPDAHLERVMSIVFAYENLRSQNIANLKELIYLFAGKQLEYFHVKDVSNKFGSEWTIGSRKILETMCKISYIKKIPRKDAWFITELGEKRLRDVIYSICMIRPKPYIKNELP